MSRLFFCAFLFLAGADAWAAETPVPRTVIALYDGAESGIQTSYLHTMAEMPLNHLGLKMEYHDVRGKLPSLEDRQDVRGIITWFSSRTRIDPKTYAAWAADAVSAGKKYVVMGAPGIAIEENTSTANKLLAATGIKMLGNWNEWPIDASYDYQTPSMFLTREPFAWTQQSYGVMRLPSKLLVKGNSIGGGRLEIKGDMNALKQIPDLDLDAKIENVNLPALNSYTRAYAGIDVEKGKLSVYSELIVKNNRVSGYVKPIATGISIINLEDAENPVKMAWESVVAVVVEIFTNQSRDQFATKVPLEGNLKNINTNSWAAISGIIRNAFVKALTRGIDDDVKFTSPRSQPKAR